MAVASNNSEQEVAGGVQLYTGIAPVKVVAVNPTLEELSGLGINLKTEPDYVVTLSDQEYQKITFWVQHTSPDIMTRIEILTQPQVRTNKAGDKFMWTNNRGQISWSESDPSTKYDWYKSEGVRKAYVGEDTLLEFIKAWANVANGGDCYLETIDNIVKGDVSELKSLVSSLADNRVRVLLGVKDGKYQQVYTKHFGRLKPKRDDLFVKALNDEYGNFNAEFNPDLVLQNYSPNLIVADDTISSDTDSAPW
jgi:hypothetical protein